MLMLLTCLHVALWEQKNLDRVTSVTWVTTRVTANFEDRLYVQPVEQKGADCT